MKCETPAQGELDRGLSVRCNDTDCTPSAPLPQDYYIDLSSNHSTRPSGATSGNPAKKRGAVSERTRPDLDWRPLPQGMWIPVELLQSDAFRDLSPAAQQICLFVFSRRQYAKRKKIPTNNWEPANRDNLKLPHKAIEEFFSKGTVPPPVGSTVTRSIKELMAKGFLDVVRLGGNGPGDQTTYRLTYDWRVWRKGDNPVYTTAGMSRAKGFCHPGAGTFCPAKKQIRGANSHG